MIICENVTKKKFFFGELPEFELVESEFFGKKIRETDLKASNCAKLTENFEQNAKNLNQAGILLNKMNSSEKYSINIEWKQVQLESQVIQSLELIKNSVKFENKRDVLVESHSRKSEHSIANVQSTSLLENKDIKSSDKRQHL